MPDLDWSNVHDDATFAYDDFLTRMTISLDCNSDAELQHLRYRQRIEAHKTGYTADIDCLLIIEHLLLSRLVTAICEGCFGRYGCHMCNPPMPDDGYALNREIEEERLGRPLFPNEY